MKGLDQLLDCITTHWLVGGDSGHTAIILRNHWLSWGLLVCAAVALRTGEAKWIIHGWLLCVFLMTWSETASDSNLYLILVSYWLCPPRSKLLLILSDSILHRDTRLVRGSPMRSYRAALITYSGSHRVSRRRRRKRIQYS